jgi:hypothetical protein
MATLTDHLNTTRRYLRDAAADYWSDADLVAHVNAAIKQRDVDTGQNVAVQSVALVVNQNLYVINAGSFLSRTIGVTNIVVVYGGARKLLHERPYGMATSVFQPTESYSALPAVWARLSPTQVFVAPKPNNTYAAEWTTRVHSADLVNPTDVDPLPFPWTEPVPYHAAFLARLQLQQYDEAEKYKQLYQQALADTVGGVSATYDPYPIPMARSRL